MNPHAVTSGRTAYKIVHWFAHTDLENMRELIIFASQGTLRGVDRVLEDKLRLFG